MKIVESSIQHPVTVAVGVILLVMFGAIALVRIPVQLTPDVQEPQVNVTTVWPGASPLEIERDIIDEQESESENVHGRKCDRRYA